MLKKIKDNWPLLEFILIAIAIVIAFIPMYIVYSQKMVITICLIGALLLNILYYFFKDKVSKVFNMIIKYRYFIALLLFVVLVFFKVSGSSIGIYNSYFPAEGKTSEDGVILGESRSIRSDEYMVHTPYYFSQFYNNYKKNSYLMSLSGQDMIIGYNAPVLDISIISKPLTWGYILLGNEYGLSWYWCLKTLIFLLASFEVFMIITKKNKVLSCLGAFLIAYAPAMQWWFVPHICDVFLWGTTLLALGYHFFTAKKRWLKNLYTILLPLIVCVFVLALFPSCQVPVGLIAVTLLIVFLIRDKSKITFKKKDIIRIIFMAIVALGILGYTILGSKDAIELLYNTAYPGKRVSLGGNLTLDKIFTNLTTMFLPYKDSNVLNNCEVSTFIHFAPFFLILFPLIMPKLKKVKDDNLLVGKTLFIILLIEAFFMLVGFPELLAKITLFSYINRMDIVFGFTATIFTVYMIDTIFKHKDIIKLKYFLICLSIYLGCYLLFITKENLEYLPIYIYLLEIILFALVLVAIYKRRKYFTISLMFIILIMASFTINPLRVGINPIKDHELVKVAKELNDSSEGYFLTTNNIQISSLLLANGLKVVNAVNFYPDLTKWELIDPKGKHDYEYNRYLHFLITLSKKNKTTYHLIQNDLLEINISINDLKKWNVKYLVTPTDLDSLDLDLDTVSYKLIKDVQGYRVYKLEWRD